MKQGITVLSGILGAILGVGGFAAYLTWPDKVWVYTTLLGISVAHLLVFLVAHFEMLKVFSKRRSTQSGANSLFMVLLVVAILAITNFIISRHPVRFDLSGSGAFTLSPQTVEVLKNLKEEVRVLGFFAERSGARNQARDLFENYAHQTSKFKYELIDPDGRPEVARQHNITEYDTMILKRGAASTTFREVSESSLTSALIRISRDAQKTLYFVEGHGEHPLSDKERGGYSYLNESFTGQGFSVKPLLLLSEKKVPDDAAVVILGGPQRPFAEEERVALDAYLSRGGQLFVLVDPLVETGLAPLLAKWGVQMDNDLIVDPTSGLGGVVPVVNRYPEHEITRKFNLATFFPLARSVTAAPDTSFRFEPILQSGPSSWLTTQVAGDLVIDPERDKKGPITLGGIIRHKEVAADGTNAPPAQKMRVVVFGDADFATNGVAHSLGNGDLFQNVVNWLAEEKDLVSIRSQAAKTSTLLLSVQQTNTLFLVSVLILPLTLLIVGLSIFRRRRRL
jgi:ABC-type uncharacterized transport system involved in gliding motility auxiliary subunit